MSDNIELSENLPLPFDSKKQGALVGWCIRDRTFMEFTTTTIHADWFASPLHSKIYAAIKWLRNKYHRGVTATELYKLERWNQEDGKTQVRIQEMIKECLELTKHFQLEILRDEIDQWIQTQILAKSLETSVKLYNETKIQEARTRLENGLIQMKTASFKFGTNIGFLPGQERTSLESTDRLNNAPHIFPFGIEFLDDALIGIRPKDVIILGAPTGRGKTALAAAIALNAGGIGKRVHFFALEADEHEIERRIKYGFLADSFYQDQDRERVSISYDQWEAGRLEHVFARYEEQIKEPLNEKLKNINTLYRVSGSFDLQNLEHHLSSLAGNTDLIIIDHLHYIDTNSDNENAEFRNIIKTIRETALRFEIPVIVIAHLKKTQYVGKQVPLINRIDDFHGTSEISKMATVCIMLSQADESFEVDENGEPKSLPSYVQPTFMQIGKNRKNGGITRFCALINYDSIRNKYADTYRLGKLSNANTVWEPVPVDRLPDWAKSAR